MNRMIRSAMVACLLMMLAFSAHAQMGIAAIVNDDMISTLDVEQRIALTLATTGVEDSAEMRAKMRPQIIRQLIEERLQIQEAERVGITIGDDDIAAGFANINQQRGLPPGAFQQFLADNNVPLDTVKHQMHAQIGWSSVVAQSLRSRVRITDDEVQRAREHAVQGQDIREVQISSILLALDTPEDEPSVRALAEELAGEIRNGANFSALARQFSAGGAEMVEQNQSRWVQPHQLEPVLAKVINGMQVGEVSPPIRTLSGYHLIKLQDQRSVNTAEVLDSEMLLKQITMRLARDAEQQEAEVLLDIAREVAKHPGECRENQVAGVSALEDFSFDVAFQRVQFRDIMPNLQAMLANLRVGDVSDPYATPEGIHIVQLCERIDMPRQLPDEGKVRDKLFREKIELEAAKRLRELRREALIEIRE